MSKVVADDWTFVDYDVPGPVKGLPLFISRVLAVSKHGRQFITWFNHELDDWEIENPPLALDDYIVAWTQVENPTIPEKIWA